MTNKVGLSDSQSMTEILEQVVEGEEVIFESENAGDLEDNEVDEIVEIIEEIVEEEEEEEQEGGEEEEEEADEQEEQHEEEVQSQCQRLPSQKQQQQVEHEEDEEMMEEEYLEEFRDIENHQKANRHKISNREKIDAYIKNNLLDKSQLQSTRHGGSRLGNNASKSNSSKILAYHVEEDWEDEELEHTNNSEELENNHSDAGNSRTEADFDHNLSNMDSDSQHEIVKGSGNNPVYTVLKSKKPSSSAKANQESRCHEAEFIKTERMEEEGMYYEGGDLETMYVNNSTTEESQSQQYEFADVTMENAQQEWEHEEETNQSEQEDSNQDQIFLHEDEDGQLYFKDESGILQPVYLTEDGNYAIAGTGSDDTNSQESQMQSIEEDKQDEEDTYIPQMDFARQVTNKKSSQVPASMAQDTDNEDSTVTISLIISEDEHGQKRTQVIIPATENTKCDICNKTYKTSLQLLKHNRLKHAREEDITTRNFPCDLCPKRYPDQNSLARHRKTHTGDRPFQCLECHKGFPTASVLRRHLSQHNPNSKPLPCIYCGRRFLDKANLMKHEQSHLAAEKRNHTCDVCHKPFTNASDLNIHLKTHDPDRKFDCEVCGREFNRLNNLQRHMMVHQQQGENQEVLACDVCGITYKFMSSLTRHMVTTHMNPEKLRQQAEEQRRKRENNYKRYLENRRMFESQRIGGYPKDTYSYYSSRSGIRSASDQEDEEQH